ncbi:hypothetical protein PG999_001357 [Apiospora kogelbergensis]|uniref:Ankyrin repeat-containing protein n=1 Tax=Apiospora kogelbergensis TaxID=1337665 RepID=A0AAW0RED8_9PEZI
MIISRRRRERARTLNLTCKVLLKSVDESLSHDSALLLACNQGTLYPLEEQRKSGSFSLDRYLDIIQIRFGDSSIGTPYLLRPTPLTLALSRGHLSVAEYLIEQGADVNLPEDVSKVADDKSANPRRPLKWFPIHFASLLSRDLNREGDAVRVLEKLLARDASPDQQMIGWSPSSHANTPLLQLLEGCSNRVSLDALKTLLRHGAGLSRLDVWSRCTVPYLSDRILTNRLSRHEGGGGDDRDLIVRCAMVLFSILDVRSPLPDELMRYSSDAQEENVVRMEKELRAAASSPQQRSIEGQIDTVE